MWHSIAVFAEFFILAGISTVKVEKITLTNKNCVCIRKNEEKGKIVATNGWLFRNKEELIRNLILNIYPN